MSKTLRKTVVLAVRPYQKEFYVLEDDLDPTTRAVPRILARYSY